jgi:arylsulfatase A-like enzyme
MTDIITRRSVDFITHHAARPFFLEVAYNAAHWPFQSPHHQPDALAKGRPLVQMPGNAGNPTRKDYAEMLERADEGVGRS